MQELLSSWFSVYDESMKQRLPDPGFLSYDESRKQRLPDPGFYWFELQNGGEKNT